MATIKQHFDIDMLQFRANTAFPAYLRIDGTYTPVPTLGYDAAVEETAFLRTRAINYGTGAPLVVASSPIDLGLVASAPTAW